MPFDTSWDIDYYKTDYESEEHWNLRKRFMQVHKDKFPEDELVCLAQVFINTEFMGCKYPIEVQQQVAHLSEEVASEFRKERAGKLKRTFVTASDAAEARAKGRRTQAGESNASKNPVQFQKRANPDTAKLTNAKKPKMNLLNNLKFGKFVLYLVGGRNCLKVSEQRCSVKVEEKECLVGTKKKVDIYVGGKLVASNTAESMKEAKAAVFLLAIESLMKECFTIQINDKAEAINISKTNSAISVGVSSPREEQKIDSNNIGYKMMKKLGWSGGGLGSKTQGREDPVDFLIKNNRKGLGNTDGKIDSQYFRQMLINYIQAEDIRDLHFQSTFTKEERAALHEIAAQLGLKSSSYGKDDARYLVVSKKKIPPEQILEEVLINKNPMYMDKFIVQVPVIKAHDFPDNANMNFKLRN